MARANSTTRRVHSPTLTLDITPEQYERAVKSSSGSCLVADAIKAQYPKLTGINVDMATVRVSDKKIGYRFIYLTPDDSQLALLFFDQGWDRQPGQLIIKGAVQILPMKSSGGRRTSPEARAARIAELEAKQAAGTATRPERAALTNMKRTPDRPRSSGKAKVTFDNGKPTVRGGKPRTTGRGHPGHPNLLAGRNRHFGAKLADPGIAFREAVDKAVAERLAEPGPAEGSS